MPSANAIFRNGQVVLDGKVDWENGLPLVVVPQPELKLLESDFDPTPRGNGQLWPETPHELETFLAEMDALEPLMDEAAADELEENLQGQRRDGKRAFDERAAEIEQLFS